MLAFKTRPTVYDSCVSMVTAQFSRQNCHVGSTGGCGGLFDLRVMNSAAVNFFTYDRFGEYYDCIRILQIFV